MDEDNFEVKRIKILSMIFSMQDDLAKDFVMEIFDFQKYILKITDERN